MELITKIYNKLNVLYDFIKNYFNKSSEFYYIVENPSWVILDVAKKITSNLDLNYSISNTHLGITNSIIHYGSINVFIKGNKIAIPDKSNKVVVTWYHIVPGDKRLDIIKQADKYVDLWHTSCKITKNQLIKNGINPKKIVVIPIGVDLNIFYVPEQNDSKLEFRSKIGIPCDKFVIGSFQKDGNGWGEGNDPKLIKGPDIFCDVVEKLNKKHDIFVLLTGPSRGYVKNRLKKAGIQFKHKLFENISYLRECYLCLDLYLSTSRVEGGPQCILESMACGVPIISTKVGQSPEIIVDGENGYLSNVEDVEMLCKLSEKVIYSNDIREKFIKNGINTSKNYSWKKIADEHFEKMYKRYLKNKK